MKRVENCDVLTLQTIGKKAGRAFVSSPGPFAMYFTLPEAEAYFIALVKMAYAQGFLYEEGEGNGYAIIVEKKNYFSFWQRFLFACRLYAAIPVIHMQRYMDALKDWKDYEEKNRRQKNYINLFMIFVPEQHQNKGYFSRMIHAIQDEADRRNLMVLFDTDAEIKAQKYEHLGCEILDDQIMLDGNHMYTLCFRPKK